MNTFRRKSHDEYHVMGKGPTVYALSPPVLAGPDNTGSAPCRAPRPMLPAEDLGVSTDDFLTRPIGWAPNARGVSVDLALVVRCVDMVTDDQGLVCCALL
jgi:hypothetical protein